MPGDGQRDLGPVAPPVPSGGLFGPGKKLRLVLAGCGLVLLVGLGLIQMTYPRGLAGAIGDKAWQFVCVGNDCRTIVANKVMADQNGRLVGSFTVRKSGLLGGIHSDGISGACLFVESAALNLPASVAPAGGACASDSECTGVVKDDPLTLAEDPYVGWERLCHAKTCWIRPGNGAPRSDVCNKGVAAKDEVPNPSNDPAFDPAKLKNILAESAKNRSVRFRILACLNGTFVNGQPPCGGNPGDLITNVGDVSEFSVPQ